MDIMRWLREEWWIFTWPNDRWMRQRIRRQRRQDRERRKWIKRELRDLT